MAYRVSINNGNMSENVFHGNVCDEIIKHMQLKIKFGNLNIHENIFECMCDGSIHYPLNGMVYSIVVCVVLSFMCSCQLTCLCIQHSLYLKQ